jgi:hypothetical protein
MPTEFAQQALAILRDPGLFQWYVIPLLAIVMYIYASEIRKGCRDAVFAGLAFWGADWINEILNSVFFHLNGHAPLWGAPGGTAYLILIGLNIEIMFMFAIAGIAWAKMLPVDPAAKILGVPNRWFIALVGSAFCVLVEILLNRIDAFFGPAPRLLADHPLESGPRLRKMGQQVGYGCVAIAFFQFCFGNVQNHQQVFGCPADGCRLRTAYPADPYGT